MRTINIEQEPDFIGGQDPLTKEEEKLISEYIRLYREKKIRKNTLKSKLSKKRELVHVAK